MKIAITGGTGFIGTAVSKMLIENGEEIKILSRNKAQPKLKAEYIQVDYADENSLLQALKDTDLVIHLAAALFCRSKSEYFKANSQSTLNLANAANKAEVKKIVYISSLAAGGPSKKEDRTEDISDNPVSYYGKSKLEAEKKLEIFKGKKVILRPPIVYGPKDAGFSKIAQWVRKGLMIVPGSVKTEFSFIYLNDLAECVKKAVYGDFQDNEKFYICENKTYQWGDFISKMAAAMKVKEPKMISLPPAALYTAGIMYEIFSYILSTEPVLNRDKAREAAAGKWTAKSDKWQKHTGFSNWTSLENGLKKTFSEAK